MIVTLAHSHGLGVLCDKDLVANMGVNDKEVMNSSLLLQCPWLPSIFYDARGCVIWGYLNVPLWYKKLSNVTPQLKVAPRGVTFAELEEHLWIQSGGSINYSVLFPIWHIAHDGCLAMNAPLQKVGVHMILYFIVENRSHHDWDYKLGDQVLPRKDGILCKSESWYESYHWTITSLHTNGTIRVQWWTKSKWYNTRRVTPFLTINF